tara:strand:- start:342 stop:938 length:597 start_codon:yes stop_codon:yes gene_type:complete
LNFLYIKSKKSLSKYKKYINYIFSDYDTHKIDNKSYFFIDKRNIKDCFFNDNNYIGYILGYIRDFNYSKSENRENQNRYCAAKISDKQWPLTNNFTGSFSLFNYNKNNKEISISNDPIGIYPIYYYIDSNNIVISSNLILSALITNQKTDITGVVEKLISNEYASFGKRTTVKNISRILPGEALYISSNNYSIIEKKI